MNKTEADFELLLYAMKSKGEISDYAFEPFKLRLGSDWKTSWTPDFAIQHLDGTIELVDVKGGGGVEQHTAVKAKVAARLFPCFSFSYYHRKSAKAAFVREEIQ